MEARFFIEQIYQKIPAEYVSYYGQHKNKLHAIWEKIAPQKWYPRLLDDGTIQFPMEHKLQLLANLDKDDIFKGKNIYLSATHENNEEALVYRVKGLKDEKEEIFEDKITKTDADSFFISRLAGHIKSKELENISYEDKSTLLQIIFSHGYLENTSQSIPIISFLKNLLQLYNFLGFRGIEKLLEGFSNPEEISSKFFEINCAYFCLLNKKITDIIFSPEVVNPANMNKFKYPEFKFNFNRHEIYCECKSLLSMNRVAESKLLRFSRAINKSSGLKDITIPDSLRIEVCVDLVSTNPNFGQRLKEATKKLIEGKLETIEELYDYKGKGKITYCIRNNNAPFFLEKQINIGIFPRAKDKSRALKDFKLVFSYKYKKKEIHRAIKSNIEDALSQLPKEINSIIFIEVFEIRWSIDAAKNILRSQKYKNIVCVILDAAPHGRHFVARSEHRSTVSSLFSTSKIYI